MKILIELGASILEKILLKLLDEVFPTKSISSNSEVAWEINITRKGMNIKYNKKESNLNKKQIAALLNDSKMNREFSDLHKNILESSNDLDSRNYKVKTKGSRHSIEINEENSIKGSIRFKDNLTYEEVYKRAFLRGEALLVEEVSFVTMNPEMQSAIDALEQELSKYSSMSVKSNTPPDIIKCNAIFESASKKYKYENISIKLSIYDYTEDSVTLSNHLDKASLINLKFIVQLSNNQVALNYSLTQRGNKDVDALIKLNTLNRLLAHEDLKLTIKELGTDKVFFTGILPKVKAQLKSVKKELENEIKTLQIIQRAEKEFNIKFKVSRALTESDKEALNILEMLFNDKNKIGKSKGIITMTFKPHGPKVLNRIEGNLTLTNGVGINLFDERLKGITRVINFYNLREVGHDIKHRKRFSDGSLEIKFNQFGNRKVIEEFILTEKLDGYFK